LKGIEVPFEGNFKGKRRAIFLQFFRHFLLEKTRNLPQTDC